MQKAFMGQLSITRSPMARRLCHHACYLSTKFLKNSTMIMMSSYLQNPIEKKEEPKTKKEHTRKKKKKTKIRPKQGKKKL
jgi:hypothetical protein